MCLDHPRVFFLYTILPPLSRIRPAENPSPGPETPQLPRCNTTRRSEHFISGREHSGISRFTEPDDRVLSYIDKIITLENGRNNPAIDGMSQFHPPFLYASRAFHERLSGTEDGERASNPLLGREIPPVMHHILVGPGSKPESKKGACRPTGCQGPSQAGTASFSSPGKSPEGPAPLSGHLPQEAP